jgi:hypothetical protein
VLVELTKWSGVTTPSSELSMAKTEGSWRMSVTTTSRRRTASSRQRGRVGGSLHQVTDGGAFGVAPTISMA